MYIDGTIKNIKEALKDFPDNLDLIIDIDGSQREVDGISLAKRNNEGVYIRINNRDDYLILDEKLGLLISG